MAFSDSSKQNISIKKLTGRSHTSNNLEFFNESKFSGVTTSADAVFGESIPTTPGNTNLYDITSSRVELVRLVATALPESLVNGKYHAFRLSLPSDYETNSAFTGAGTGEFLNNKAIWSTRGVIQLVPPSFGDRYEGKVFYGGTGAKNSGTRIPVLDERTWYLDYFNGIIFQETPPDSADENPSYVEAYVYIGQMASERFTEGDGGGGGATDLDDLTDVTITTPTANKHFLVNNGSGQFVNRTISTTDLSDGTDVLKNTSSIADLSDVNVLTNIQDGNVLAWNSDNSRFEFTTPAVTYTNEEARDAAGTALAGGTHTGISFVNNDDGDTIDATVSLSGFSIGDLSNVDITTNAPTNNQVLKWDGSSFVPSDDTGKTQEEIEDIVGGMVNGGTETDITVTYDDNNGKLDFVVDNTIARLASPTFTGTPLAPTAAVDTNTTQIATTAFVQTQITALGLGSAAQSDEADFLAANSTSIDDLTDVDITTNAPTNNQVLKWDGSSFVPSDDTGKTQEEIEDIVGGMVDGGTETDITVTYDDNNGKLDFVVNNTIARLDDPDFTGTPTAPTAAVDTNTTQIATTAFVQTQINNIDLNFLSADSTSIDDLTDVDITTNAPTNGQILKWDNANSKFVPSDDIGRTDEAIQDLVGAQLVTNGVHTGLTAAYDDAGDGAIDLTVDNTVISFLAGSQTFTGDKTFTGAVDLTGSNATASTKNASDNSTSIATTAYVDNQIDTDIASLDLGNTYQPLDAGLTSISGLTTVADRLIYTTAADTYAVSVLTEFARSILDDTDAQTVRATISAQESDATLTALAGLNTAADQIIYATGVDTFAMSSLSANARTFLGSSVTVNDLTDALIAGVSNAQILVYNSGDGENDNKWKNVSLRGDVLISSSGEMTIQEDAVTNSMIENSFITITDGTNTDKFNLGETLTFSGTANEIEITSLNDVNGDNAGNTITIGLPDDVTIGNDLTVTRDLVVTRNFTVNGISSTISTTNLDVEDSVISLNNGLGDVANTNDIGLFFDRGNLNPALVIWDEADDVFKIGSHAGANISSSSTDFADADFSYEALEVKTVAADSNDNSVATTEWVSTKVNSEISSTSINDLTDVDTTDKAEGKILKFNADGNLVAVDNDGFVADTSSLWAVSDDGTELYPHGIIDGTLDTGMFAINLSAGSLDFTDLNVTLYDVLEELSSMNSYTPSTRAQNAINDTYFEFDADGNIMPKAAS